MKIRRLFAAFILGSVTSPWVGATTLVRLSLDQLTQASTDIVRGHVVRQETRWTPEHTEIETLTTIAVDQAIKGQPQTTLVIRQLGGTVGNIRSHVAGTAHFRPQTDYLLFLERARSDPAVHLVVGMAQGAYRIVRNPVSKEEHVISPLGEVFEGPRASSQAIPLNQFEQRISTALASPIVIPRGTSLPVIIESTESRGAGRVRVIGRTVAASYPSSIVVVPAGSSLEGMAQLVSGVWKIHWTELSIRGTQVPISASSEEPRGESLRGNRLAVEVR
jgi:hypothetical protein